MSISTQVARGIGECSQMVISLRAQQEREPLKTKQGQGQVLTKMHGVLRGVSHASDEVRKLDQLISKVLFCVRIDEKLCALEGVVEKVEMLHRERCELISQGDERAYLVSLTLATIAPIEQALLKIWEQSPEDLLERQKIQIGCLVMRHGLIAAPELVKPLPE